MKVKCGNWSENASMGNNDMHICAGIYLYFRVFSEFFLPFNFS